jgi:hypothetical protein
VIVVALAGAATDAVAARRDEPLRDDDVENDWAQAKDCADEQSDSAEAADRVLESCRQRSLDLPSRHWNAIEAISQDLAATKKLSDQQVRSRLDRDR